MRCRRGLSRGFVVTVVALAAACGDDTSSTGTGSGTGSGGQAPSGSTGGTGSGSSSSGSDAGAGGDPGAGGGTGDGGATGNGGEGGVGGGGGSAPLAADGAACETNADCIGGICLGEAIAGYPGGLCASPCDRDEPSSCDGFCQALTGFGDVCRRSCLGEDSDCRELHLCEGTPLSDHFFCVPDCRDDAECPGTGQCSLDSNRCVVPETDCENLLDDNDDGRLDCADPGCVGTPACEAGDVPLGGPCRRHADCASDSGMPLCVPEEAGVPGGACAQHCDNFVPGLEATSCATPDAACQSTNFYSTFSIAHCPFDGCTNDDDCRDGYACCDVCQADGAICVPFCDGDDECVDTGGTCTPWGANHAVCRVAVEEICGNGLDDDDHDGADCRDDACDVYCDDLQDELCADAPDLAASQAGETAPGPGIGGQGCIGSAWGAVSPQVYRYEADATGTLGLGLTSVFPQAIAVHENCAFQSQVLGCVVDEEFDGDIEVDVAVEAGSTYFVLVWAAAQGHEDEYVLTAEMP